ncbi:TPA: DUF59 domain-containing protein [Candidatus Woesearchaeota archaeon]|nr:DUF59 domain-containing protein [Candidatus Woesearchaeota archaeon]
MSALSKKNVLARLKLVEDPEIHCNIIDLGLVYNVKIDGGMVVVDMTLTSPACPVGPFIISEAESAVKKLPGVKGVTVNIIWEPLWSPERMSEEARVALGV